MIAAVGACWAACVDSASAPAPARQVAKNAEALEAEGGTPNHEEPAPPLVSVRLASEDANGRFDIEVSSESGLELVVANMADEEADLELEVTYWCDDGRGRSSVPLSTFDAGSSDVINVDPSLLRLPPGAFETSGSIYLTAEGVLAGATRVRSLPVPLAFHPVPGGWRIYDVATRERTYAGGALSDAARAARERALRRLPFGARLGRVGRARSTGSHESVDWVPTEDGPSDREHGGAE